MLWAKGHFTSAKDINQKLQEEKGIRLLVWLKAKLLIMKLHAGSDISVISLREYETPFRHIKLDSVLVFLKNFLERRLNPLMWLQRTKTLPQLSQWTLMQRCWLGIYIVKSEHLNFSTLLSIVVYMKYNI